MPGKEEAKTTKQNGYKPIWIDPKIQMIVKQRCEREKRTLGYVTECLLSKWLREEVSIEA